MAEYLVYDSRDDMVGAKALNSEELRWEYRERVIRCRDCRYFGHDSWGVDMPICRRWSRIHPTREDDFCSRGIPRGDA